MIFKNNMRNLTILIFLLITSCSINNENQELKFYPCQTSSNELFLIEQKLQSLGLSESSKENKENIYFFVKGKARVVVKTTGKNHELLDEYFQKISQPSHKF